MSKKRIVRHKSTLSDARIKAGLLKPGKDYGVRSGEKQVIKSKVNKKVNKRKSLRKIVADPRHIGVGGGHAVTASMVLKKNMIPYKKFLLGGAKNIIAGYTLGAIYKKMRKKFESGEVDRTIKKLSRKRTPKKGQLLTKKEQATLVKSDISYKGRKKRHSESVHKVAKKYLRNLHYKGGYNPYGD